MINFRKLLKAGADPLAFHAAGVNGIKESLSVGSGRFLRNGDQRIPDPFSTLVFLTLSNGQRQSPNKNTGYATPKLVYNSDQPGRNF